MPFASPRQTLIDTAGPSSSRRRWDRLGVAVADRNHEMSFRSGDRRVEASTHPCDVNSVKYMKILAPGATEPTTHMSSMTSPVVSRRRPMPWYPVRLIPGSVHPDVGDRWRPHHPIPVEIQLERIQAVTAVRITVRRTIESEDATFLSVPSKFGG